MEKKKLIKTSVDLPETLFERLQKATRFKGEFTHIIRTGIEKELDERERRQATSTEQRAAQPDQAAS